MLTEQERLERQRAIKSRWRAKHREAYNAAQKRWRDKNPEKAKEIQHRCYRKTWPSWRAKNREKHNAYLLAYYHKNKERCKSWVSPEARARNKERLMAWIASLSPEKNRELKRACSAKYHAKFRDVLNAKRRERHAQDPMKNRLAQKKARRARIEHYREMERLAQKRKPALRLHHQRLREARKKAVTIGDLAEIAKVYDKARWWKQWFAVVVDHIIPLSRGGTHEARNLQIIYAFENQAKYNDLNYKPRVVFT